MRKAEYDGAMIFVLDTCVLISALRSSLGASHQLLRCVRRAAVTPALSVGLVLEYEAVCGRHLEELKLTSGALTELLDYLCSVGDCRAVRYRVRPSLPDPSDEMVLETAVAAGGVAIVTHNIKDLKIGAARFGIEVLTPAQALRKLGDDT